ncbi:hypothetical protein G7A66_02405 [Altererythrobacter sp. SALINAS58]|uniref:hypothetical protein n=1 Tax=Alteripontixanthobacter muriae TaxID=2705546 RepID=UPI0015770188|nr:hypothetical protein [Alteripontixanthobacter muriae]NTZ41962.1 hypothetical protein [Alteripontixanthobacter muriae]
MRKGTLIAYDSGRGAGLIQPDSGGPVIVFGMVDQPRLYPEPKLFQRYSYSVLEAIDGGQPRAFNLAKSSRLNRQVEPGLCAPSQVPLGNQESFMGLNELLHSRQLAVMNLSVAGSGDASGRRSGA